MDDEILFVVQGQFVKNAMSRIVAACANSDKYKPMVVTITNDNEAQYFKREHEFQSDYWITDNLGGKYRTVLCVVFVQNESES